MCVQRENEKGVMMEDIKNWSTEKLKKECVILYDAIYNHECIEESDSKMMNKVCEELSRRNL